MRQTLSKREVCKILGVNSRTIDRWIFLEILRPVETENGLRYSLLTTLAIGLGRDLRQRGFSTKQIGNVIEWLYDRSLDELQSEWKAGRTHLLSVAGCPPFPKLFSREAIFGNPAVDLEAAFKSGVSVIDVAEEYRKIVAKLDAEPKRERCTA